MTQDVRGRVALVTGSTRGVGEAVARRLLATRDLPDIPSAFVPAGSARP